MTQYVRVSRGAPFKSARVISLGADGTVTQEAVYERKRRRGSKRLRRFERVARRLANAQGTASQDYLARHERSNRKKRNGWAKDLGRNVTRASRKGLRKMKIRIL